MAYIAARPSEILVITGFRINDVKLTKKAWIWPGQHYVRLCTSPVNYAVDVHAMSSEKLRFLMPAVFTIGLRMDDEEGLLRYAKVMPLFHRKFEKHQEDLVLGIIVGETRVVAASMTIEEIFKGTKEFKQQVFDKVQLELNKFGLYIYNANVKQLKDTDGSTYFSNLGRKIQMDVAEDVAEVETTKQIGSKNREARIQVNAAKVDSETKIQSTKMKFESESVEMKIASEKEVFKNEMDSVVAESASLLEIRKAAAAGRVRKAQIEAEKANKIREAELELELEMKTGLVNAEQARVQSTLEFEARVQEANSIGYQQQKNTDALFYAQEKDVQAKRMAVDVELYTSQRRSDAELYRKKREAEALVELSDAHAHYVRALLGALGGNYNALRDYLMIQNGLYRDMAWSLGAADPLTATKPCLRATQLGGFLGYEYGSVNDVLNGAVETVSGLYKMVNPVLEHAQDKAGGTYKPDWVGCEAGYGVAKSSTTSSA